MKPMFRGRERSVLQYFSWGCLGVVRSPSLSERWLQTVKIVAPSGRCLGRFGRGRLWRDAIKGL